LKSTDPSPLALPSHHRNALHTALPPVTCLVQDDEPSDQPFIIIQRRELRNTVSLIAETSIASLSIIDNLLE